MKEIIELTKVEDIRTLSDPYRLEILNKFFERENPSTVKQIADDLKEVPAKVYYHVKKMVNSNILELDHTEVINGIIAKYYIPTAKEFHVKRGNNPDQKVISATQVLIDNIFDKNKKELMQQLNKKDVKLTCATSVIYLTKEDYEQINNWINEKSRKIPNGDKKPYMFFSSIVSTEEENDGEEK